MSNNRPISIIPALGKVMESAMKHQLVTYFETNNLFLKNQHGFRRGHSTTSALVSLVTEALEALEGGESLELTLCDLSKAFDCVSHQLLLAKLEHYGVSNSALKTMASYLQNRRQVVEIEGARSEEVVLAHGVPQGSILGPLLFLVLVNDLDLDGRTLLFADDTTLLTRGRDLDLLHEESAALFNLAKDWFAANKLQLNEEKTQSLLCTLKRQENAASSLKLLGFWLDAKITWSDHISHVCHRLSRVLFLLRRLRTLVPKDFLISAYFALFHSHIKYGIILWGHAADTKNVLLLQKKAVRLMSFAGTLDHCRPLFTNMGILTVHGQYVIDLAVFVKSNQQDFATRSATHDHNTRYAMNLDVPRCRLTKTLKSFPTQAIKVFNALPNRLKELPDRKFKKLLHERLIQSPLYNLNEFFEEPWRGGRPLPK
jgi:hypothetical protein